MRTYSDFLLMETLLDNLPTSNPNLYNFGYDVTNPYVTVVEADCHTTVGKSVTLDFSYQGYVEVATDLPLTQTRITTILSQGIYAIGIRMVDHCTSAGGICQKCYNSTFIDKTTPDISTTIRIEPEFNYQTDTFLSDGTTASFTLSEDAANYTKAIVIINGAIFTDPYTIVNNILTLGSAQTIGTYVNVRFYKNMTQPFLAYVAGKYTGALLGMSPLPSLDIHIRPSLIQSNITDDKISNAVQQLRTSYPMITTPYMHYMDKIIDPLEKALYILVLFGIYGNVNT